METYKKDKGDLYEKYVMNNLLQEYDKVYYFKDTPEYVISKTKLYTNYEIYIKYKNCDIGADLVAIKNDDVYFIQCKNFNNTISINDFCSFYFLILEYDLKGIVYYNGILSERLTDLAQGKIEYHNLPYNNTIMDVELNIKQNIEMIPRDYQLDIVNKFKNVNRGVIGLPCGMGKTYTSWLIGKKYENLIILSPTRNLAISNLVNLHKYSKNAYNPILISMDGKRNIENIKNIIKDKNIFSVTYDSVDVFYKIFEKINNKILFVDEYHNLSISNLENRKNYVNKLISDLNTKTIFLSATPLITKKHNKIFGKLFYKYSWNDAIKNKFICDFKIVLPTNTNSNVTTFNDFLTDIKYKNEDKEFVIKIFFILKAIKFHGNKKTIIYSSSIDDANKYLDVLSWMQKLINIDVETNIINCKTSKTKRFEYINNFIKNKKNQILLNVQILNEGIDIPECDSVFITKPNDNMTNLIQRMCRSNRILPNKYFCYIYLWNDNNIINKIKDYLDDVDDFVTKKIEYLSFDKLKNNNIENKYENSINIENNINYDRLYNYLKSNTNIECDGFIEMYCDNYLKNEYDFTIKIDLISKWLNVRKDHLKKLLISNFVKNTDYIEVKENGKKGRGVNNTIHILLTYSCAKLLCMISKCEKASLIRNFYVELEKLIIKYKDNIVNDLNNQLGINNKNKKIIESNEKEGLIYILRVNDEIKKIGTTGDIKKRMNLYKVGKVYELPIVLVYKSKNILEVEKCVKKNLSSYRVKKNANNELFKIDSEFIKETIIYCNKMSTKVKENKKLFKSIDDKSNWMIIIDKKNLDTNVLFKEKTKPTKKIIKKTSKKISEKSKKAKKIVKKSSKKPSKKTSKKTSKKSK